MKAPIFHKNFEIISYFEINYFSNFLYFLYCKLSFIFKVTLIYSYIYKIIIFSIVFIFLILYKNDKIWNTIDKERIMKLFLIIF